MPDDAYDPASLRVLAGMEPRQPGVVVGIEDDIERRPMGIHDALEAWAEGRLSVERALQLTHAADVAEMLVLCHVNEVSRPLLSGPSLDGSPDDPRPPGGVPGGVPEPPGEPRE